MRDTAETAALPSFTQPIRQIASMVCVLILVALGTYLALPNVMPVFQANPLLNGFIVFVFFIGVAATFWQVYQVFRSVAWINRFTTAAEAGTKAPRLLTPLANLMRDRRGRQMQISPNAAGSLLDSVGTRIEEVREITRYITNLLIFLGLLGTFYGLATTVPAIVDTIRALAPQEGEDGMAVFGRLMDGLEAQLGGMGVAFASSLLGLAGSLVVGLLELFANHGQNRFFRQLEEWLSSITRIGFAGADAEPGNETAAAMVMMEHMATQVDRLQEMFVASDVSRGMVDERLGELADGLQRFADRMEAEMPLVDALRDVARGQQSLVDSLRATAENAGGLDAESRMRLRSIDVQLLRLTEDIAAGRHESTSELRQDLRQIARALGRDVSFERGR